jgi:hypothetical protein
MIRSLAKSGYQFAKRSPLLRRIARTPMIARLKSRVAPWVLLGDSEYERWMANRLTTRHLDYQCHPEPNLLSLLTTAWNTPPQYLRILADSVLQQRGVTDFEWIVLDNGSTKPATRKLLDEIAASDPRVQLLRVEDNLGIVGGMRLALEQATGRYVLPVDSDDYLYPDCLQVVTSCLQRHDHPAILYSDEDHLLGRKFVLPYFKPDWDPVLFQSCAYIAHLGVFDRRQAMELGVYSDLRMNGCHDWDTFERFRQAGHVPQHIPEVLYSWRMHSGSTAANINSKAYIRKSHRALLTGVLQRQPHPERFELELNPLFHGTPDWRFRRLPGGGRPMLRVTVGREVGVGWAPCPSVKRSQRSAVRGQRSDIMGEDHSTENHTAFVSRDVQLCDLLNLIRDHASPDGLVAFVSDDISIENPDWTWEAAGLFELHPDTAVVGGRIVNHRHMVLDAGRVLGFGRGCDSPERGRSEEDPGYYAQVWKPRSVSAVSTQFCVFETRFLCDLLTAIADQPATLPYLGAWAGAFAKQTGRRIVTSPFLLGRTNEDWDDLTTDTQRVAFTNANHDVLPDTRFYPGCFGSDAARPYDLAVDAVLSDAA